MSTKPRFAVIGVAGYIARRHLDAIRDVGGEVVAAFDVSDSVGQMDASFPAARFFTEFENFEAYVQDLKRNGRGVDYVTICSPNHLHRAHIAFGLRVGADVICEKPLVLEPAHVRELIELEKHHNKKVSTILQLRLNPANVALREELRAYKGPEKLVCDLTYVTSRGQWYYVSWKGQEAKSGGIATNIGVHFFDLLSFIFGPPARNVVHHRAVDCAAGYLEYPFARVRWFLSINGRDLPTTSDDRTACRQITIGDRVINLSGDFRELHTKSYREVLAGRGFPMTEALGAVETVSHIRTAPPLPASGDRHPYLDRVLVDKGRYHDGFPV